MRPRPIRMEGAAAVVPLTRGHEAIIDAGDAPLVEGKNWHALITSSGKIYAARPVMRDGKQGLILMHRELIGVTPDLEVDHKDNNGLNNRRSNLRPCTHQQNMANQVVSRRNRLGLKGTSARGNRFESRIHFGGRRYLLGYYDTPEEAAAAYRGAAVVLNGKFSNGGAKK